MEDMSDNVITVSSPEEETGLQGNTKLCINVKYRRVKLLGVALYYIIYRSRDRNLCISGKKVRQINGR